MADRMTVTVPDLGDYHDVPVIEVLVAEGDRVQAEQPLLVLESDKATMEVPAPAAGIVRGLRVKVGDRINAGDAICELETEADAELAPASQPEAVADDGDAGSATRSDGGAADGRTTTVTVPDLGDYHDVPVIEVLVADGDRVQAEQPLLVLESDKATMEVPAPAAGVVRGLRVKVGDRLNAGDAICELETDTASGDERKASAGDEPTGEKAGGEAAAGDAPATAGDTESAPSANRAAGGIPIPERAVASPPPEPRLADGELPPLASPAVRKFARHLGVDLRRVRGSGRNGRILREDVEAWVREALRGAGAASAASSGFALPEQPDVDHSRFGPVETQPLPRIRRISARHLHRNWLLVPHVTQTDEADITELEAFRKARNAEGGVKLTLLPFVIKAVAHALRQYPEFNASLAADGETLVLKRYCHIGFAADTPHGLVVPVVRDVWSKGITELAEECAALAARAREGKLRPEEMSGGCFSISSLGGIGGSHFTPIVNAPEVGILGVSRATIKPVWDGEQFRPRLMCPLSLSYDHRVIDGAYAARFITTLTGLLADIRRLLL